MDTIGGNCLHQDAAEYYDELATPREADVPDSIVRHVCECPVCRARIRRLRETVAGTAGEASLHQGHMDRDIIEILNLHFRCLGEPVTCSRTKPFLPGLLIPSRRIRIPTPITVHVDHCPPCAKDLRALRELALEPEQLERLGRLYAAKSAGKSLPCRQARLKTPAFAAASLEGIEDRLRNHLCTCRQCRALVYQYRQSLLSRELSQDAGAGTECLGNVSMADVFDYVVAYDLPAEGPKEAGSPKRPAGAHVRTCRRCLEQIQTLHRTAYRIAERPDSGIVTTFQTAAQARRTPASDDLYPDYPVAVQVSRHQAEPAAAPRRWPTAAAALRRTVASPRVKPLLKAALVAAAVIPLTVLFLTTPGASGISLAQVVHAFQKAENVHVARFYAPTGELTQELWISRSMNLVVTREGQERVLYDLGARKKHVYPASEAAAEVAELSERQYANARWLIDVSLGFTLNEVPAGARWARADDNAAEGAEVYELTYTLEDATGRSSFRKRRITVDPLTALPREIQNFSRRSAQEGWSYESKREFRYLTEDDITALLDEQHLRGAVY